MDLYGDYSTEEEQQKEEIKYNWEAFKKQFGRSPGEPRRIVVLDKQIYPESVDLEKISDYDGFSGFPLISVAATQLGGRIETLQVSNLSGISVVIQARSVPTLNVPCWSELVAMLMNPAVLKFGQPVAEHVNTIKQNYNISVAGWYNLEYLFNSDLDDVSSSLYKTLSDYSQRLFGIEPPEPIPAHYYKPSAPQGLSECDVRAAKRTQIALDVAAFQLLKITQTRDPLVWGYQLVPKIPTNVTVELKAEKFENYVERAVVGDYSRSAPVSSYWRGDFIAAGQTMQKFWLICTEARKRMFQSRPEGPNSTVNHADMVRYLAGRLKKLRSDCGTDVASEEERKNWLSLDQFLELTEDFASPPCPLYDWTNDENGVFSCVCTLGFDSIIYRQTVKETVPVGKGDVIEKANAAALASQTWSLMFLDEVEAFLEDLRNSDLAGVPRLGVPPETTVFIGNISPLCSNELILNVLRLMGSVISWDRAKGNEGEPYRKFGFCKYKHPNVTLRAVRILDGFPIGHEKLTVKVDEKMQKVLMTWDEKMRTAKRRGARSQKSQEVLDIPFRKAAEDLVANNYPSPPTETFRPDDTLEAKAAKGIVSSQEPVSAVGPSAIPPAYYGPPMYWARPRMRPPPPPWGFPGMPPPWHMAGPRPPPHMIGMPRPSYHNVPPPAPLRPPTPASTSPTSQSDNPTPPANKAVDSTLPSSKPPITTSAQPVVPNFLRAQLQGKKGNLNINEASSEMKTFLSAEIDRWKARNAAIEEKKRAPRCPEGATPKQVASKPPVPSPKMLVDKVMTVANKSAQRTSSPSQHQKNSAAFSKKPSDLPTNITDSKRSRENSPKLNEAAKRLRPAENKKDSEKPSSKCNQNNGNDSTPLNKSSKDKSSVEKSVSSVPSTKKLPTQVMNSKVQPRESELKPVPPKQAEVQGTARDFSKTLSNGNETGSKPSPQENGGVKDSPKLTKDVKPMESSTQSSTLSLPKDLDNKDNDDPKIVPSKPKESGDAGSLAMLLQLKSKIDSILREDPVEFPSTKDKEATYGDAASKHNGCSVEAEKKRIPGASKPNISEVTVPLTSSRAHHDLFADESAAEATRTQECLREAGRSNAEEIAANFLAECLLDRDEPMELEEVHEDPKGSRDSPNVCERPESSAQLNLQLDSDNEDEPIEPKSVAEPTESAMPTPTIVITPDATSVPAEESKPCLDPRHLTPSPRLQIDLPSMEKEPEKEDSSAGNQRLPDSKSPEASPVGQRQDSESSSSVKSLIIELLSDARGEGPQTASIFWGEQTLEYDGAEDEELTETDSAKVASYLKKGARVTIGNQPDCLNSGSTQIYEVIEVIQNAVLVRKVTIEKSASECEGRGTSGANVEDTKSTDCKLWLPTKTVVPIKN